MKILCAHCDFSPVSLALVNCKSYAMQDEELRPRLDFRIVSGVPHEDPEVWMGRVIEAAKSYDPDVIALSLYVWSRYRMYEVSRRLRIWKPELRIIWGGPDVSDESYAQELLKIHPHVDVIVRDEGERTFARLLKQHLDGGSLGDITGISFREDGAIRSTGQVEYLDDLDEIPSLLDAPEVEAIIGQLPVMALETFRGCYMGCAYCYWGGTQRRAFSNERVFSDLERILAHKNIKKIWFFDSMFGYKKSLAKEMLRFIVERKAPDQCVTFFPNLDFLDEELCQLMKDAGVYIEAGIQTINEEAYEYLNRKWDREFLDSKIPMLEKYGLRANAQQLILGLPGDNLAGFRRSVDYAFHTHPEAIQIFPFSVLPATGYWRRKEEFKVKHEGEYRIVYDSTTFPEDDMVTAGIIMAGTKWFELSPGFAIQLVALLGCTSSEWFEALGRTFMELHWKLEDTPETRPEVRQALLCQAFSEEDVDYLRQADIVRETFRRHFAGSGVDDAFEELLRLQVYLNNDQVVDSRALPDETVQEEIEAWKAHPEAIAPTRAAFNIFDDSGWKEPGGLEKPVEFIAYPVQGPVDFFGKDLPRFRVIVFGEPGVRHPALA